MNERKFISLLNLYLDGEIEPADAVELEANILSNPDRRRIYSEYCRIHRATKLAYERFRTAAEDQTATGVRTIQHAMSAPQAGGRLAGAEAGWPFRRILAWGGAAAACAAAAFAIAIRLFPTSPASIAATTPTIAPPLVAAVDQSPQEPRKVETYPAPFASAPHADPYVTVQPRVRSDPFALVSWPADFHSPEAAPVTTGGVPTLRFDLPSPASDLVDPTMQRVDRREQRVFRSHSGGDAVYFEPTGYQIHR